MIVWNELRITNDGQYFIIDVSIENEECFNDINIENIIIDNQDTYINNGPSNEPIYKYNNTLEVIKEKHLRLVLTPEDLNTSLYGNMFFVYVITSGTINSAPSCSNSNYNVMQTVLSLYPFYQESMNYIRSIEKCCDIPADFINLILRMKSVELCIRTGNYVQAIKYWNKFFLKYNCEKINCSCDG